MLAILSLTALFLNVIFYYTDIKQSPEIILGRGRKKRILKCENLSYEIMALIIPLNYGLLAIAIPCVSRDCPCFFPKMLSLEVKQLKPIVV